AYASLTNYFQQHQDEVIEIEVLPPAIQPPNGLFLTDGLNLGIPKKVLALSFVEARIRFFAGIQSEGALSKSALKASTIILLFDAEHLTATNFRKRRLVQSASTTGNHRSEFGKAVEQELAFTNSILISPSHRQSKSPTLWHHRAWLLPFVLEVAQPDTSHTECAVSELEAVLKAGERHPKNYYAWQYARRLLEQVENRMTDRIGSPNIDFTTFINTGITRVKTWYCKHPSDISGWSFLSYFLAKTSSMPEKELLLDEILRFAISLSLDNESL
ncbi:hypothetical protein BCR34DRAFT_500456, partial [Clohesyomyces aquaticus]